MNIKWIITAACVFAAITVFGIAATALLNNEPGEPEAKTEWTDAVLQAAGSAKEAPSVSEKEKQEDPDASLSFEEYLKSMEDENGFIKEEYLEEYYAIVEGWKAWNEAFRERTNPTQEGAAQETLPPVKLDGTPLSEEELSVLSEIRSRKEYGYLLYPREEAILLGADLGEEDRLSFSDVQEVLETAADGKAVFNAVLSVHRYPDTVSGPKVNTDIRCSTFCLKDGITLRMSEDRYGRWAIEKKEADGAPWETILYEWK